MASKRSQWLRGVLDLCVLGVLAESDEHGYAIGRRLLEAGLGDVQGGTLYPVLARLADAGAVTARWEPGDHGPGRKYYTLTEAGRATLQTEGMAWREFVDAADRLIS